jgi:hypothetical protein
MRKTSQARIFSSLIMSAVVLAVLAVGAGPGHAGLLAKSPVTTPGGYPVWFQDQTGMALQGCLNEPARVPILCLLPDPFLEQAGFRADQPKIFPFNFPIEHFYFLAMPEPIILEGGGTATVEFALEGAFNPDTITNPNQEMFHRMRVIFDPNTTVQGTYSIKHPWGTIDITPGLQSDPFGVPGRRGRATFDTNLGSALGNLASANDNFEGVLGDDPLFTISNFLTQTAPTPPAGFLGDCATAGPVTGGIDGFNSVEIYAPNGNRIGRTDLFVVCGQKVGLEVGPATADFGAWKLDTPSTPITFTVTNMSGTVIPERDTDADPPEGLIATLTPGFSVLPETDGCAGGVGAIPPNNTCSFDVVFTPGADGLSSGTVEIASAGNSTLSVPVSGTGDGTAPTVILATGQTAYTKDASATISGTVTDNEGGAGVASVLVALDGAAPVAADLSDSNWSFTTPALAANSTTSVVVTATDKAQLDGNSSTVNLTIIQDSIAPAVTLTSPADGSFINTKTPALTFTATDANNPFTTVSVNGTALPQVPANLALLADGQHTVTVDSGDSAGNKTLVTNSFTVDTTLPTITVTSPMPFNGRLGVAAPVLRFDLNDANPDSTKTVISLNGTALVNPVSGTTTLGPFTAGSQHTLTVNATDLAGNPSTTTLDFVVIPADGRVSSLGATPASITDALMTLRHAVKLITLDPDQFAHADVAPLDGNGVPDPNGSVDIADALVILRKIVGLVTGF